MSNYMIFHTLSVTSLVLLFQMTSKLKSLPQTVPLLLQEVMSRMEIDLGKDIVSTALCLLVCARDGRAIYYVKYSV